MEKADVVVSVRCKSTTLATLAGFFVQQRGMFTLTKSSLVRLSLEVLEGLLVENKGAIKYNDSAAAVKYLTYGGFRVRSSKPHEEPKLEDMEPWQQELVAELLEKKEAMDGKASET